jgi:hypothetical protein
VTVLTHATPHARTTTGVTAARSLPSLRPAPAPVLPTPVDRRFEELLASLPLTRSVVVDLPRRRLVVDGAPVDLTRQEFDLVAYLARSAGRVVTRDELFAAAWRSQDLSAATRTIDVHVRRVRAKSGLDGLIATVRGVGYRLNVLDGLRVEG